MPPRQNHLEFDAILRRKGVICEDTDGNSVHDRMDKKSQKYLDKHKEIDFYHSVPGIRDFIDQIVNSLGTLYEDTANDYIRIAYGHLCLDCMASKLKSKLKCSYSDLDWQHVYRRAWNCYKVHGLDKTFFQ